MKAMKAVILQCYSPTFRFFKTLFYGIGRSRPSRPSRPEVGVVVAGPRPPSILVLVLL
jgi:hypothetical protein